MVACQTPPLMFVVARTRLLQRQRERCQPQRTGPGPEKRKTPAKPLWLGDIDNLWDRGMVLLLRSVAFEAIRA